MNEIEQVASSKVGRCFQAHETARAEALEGVELASFRKRLAAYAGLRRGQGGQLDAVG